VTSPFANPEWLKELTPVIIAFAGLVTGVLTILIRKKPESSSTIPPTAIHQEVVRPETAADHRIAKAAEEAASHLKLIAHEAREMRHHLDTIADKIPR